MDDVIGSINEKRGDTVGRNSGSTAGRISESEDYAQRINSMSLTTVLLLISVIWAITWGSTAVQVKESQKDISNLKTAQGTVQRDVQYISEDVCEMKADIKTLLSRVN